LGAKPPFPPAHFFKRFFCRHGEKNKRRAKVLFFSKVEKPATAGFDIKEKATLGKVRKHHLRRNPAPSE
jgi:hypothetical protein